VAVFERLVGHVLGDIVQPYLHDLLAECQANQENYLKATAHLRMKVCHFLFRFVLLVLSCLALDCFCWCLISFLLLVFHYHVLLLDLILQVQQFVEEFSPILPRFGWKAFEETVFHHTRSIYVEYEIGMFACFCSFVSFRFVFVLFGYHSDD
jgi:hypothetical protein